MPEASQEPKTPGTTFCPFKAPARLSYPLGDSIAVLKRFEQRPGMSLVQAEFPTEGYAPSSIAWPSNSHLQILFVCQGTLSMSRAGQDECHAAAGDWLIAKPLQDSFAFQTSESCRAFWIEFDHQATLSLTGFSDTVAPELLDLEKPYLRSAPASGRLLVLAQELAALDGESTRDRLLIESKSLEWLANLLDHPAFSPCRAIVPSHNAREEVALTAAAKILSTRYAEDHSISALSRAIHLNEFKLKRGFKQRYGTTVFGFLRQKRMEAAREILESSSSSVIEAANSVGYANPSHFARAFKQAYGINPSSFTNGLTGHSQVAASRQAT